MATPPKMFGDDCHIVISEFGIQRMTKRPGKLAAGEIAVRVRFVIPFSAFAAPDVSAVINVPESAIIKPTVQVEALPAPGEGQ